jgi:cell division protein FtsN
VSRRASHGGILASFLLLLGFTTVMGLTFAAGVFAGRQWPRLWSSLGATARPAREAASTPRPAERARASRPTPLLTFYEELTAPLTAPPPPPRGPAGRPSRPAPVVKTEPGRDEPSPPPTGAGAAAVSVAPRFTVQVAAFRTWAQAEALRAELAGAGHEAYVAESESPAGARYRVRVGSFPSREAARQTAARLASDGQRRTFVTTR